MTATYNVYKNNKKIVEKINDKEYTVSDLEPDTEYSFSVTQIVNNKESKKSESVRVITQPAKNPDPVKDDDILPESIEISPKEHTFIDIWEPGTSRRFNVTILPEDADQEFTVESSDESIIRASIDGTQAVGMAMTSGIAELTVKTVNGLTATATITVPEQG